ncbi:MAG: hypothetical protein Q7S03_04030 [bacterium]|nr:hypothetical protein [bacterium]
MPFSRSTCGVCGTYFLGEGLAPFEEAVKCEAQPAPIPKFPVDTELRGLGKIIGTFVWCDFTKPGGQRHVDVGYVILNCGGYILKRSESRVVKMLDALERIFGAVKAKHVS